MPIGRSAGGGGRKIAEGRNYLLAGGWVPVPSVGSGTVGRDHCRVGADGHGCKAGGEAVVRVTGELTCGMAGGGLLAGRAAQRADGWACVRPSAKPYGWPVGKATSRGGGPSVRVGGRTDGWFGGVRARWAGGAAADGRGSGRNRGDRLW